MSLTPAFQREVVQRLEVPQEARIRYVQMLELALIKTQTRITNSQYVLLFDRAPQVQAVFLYWLDGQVKTNRWRFIGAAPASGGRPGKFDHFITPLGVYAHTLDNPDFRAEGTRNNFGILGFGSKGMRIYDFGWVQSERGWGRGRISQMRLLLHSTDPDVLEHHLGEPMSKGCIRIPESLNTFIDRNGILDADYEQALARGGKSQALRTDRSQTPWSGRYLVIVDSESLERPAWSPKPN